jgi:hypothetical protein
MDQFKLFIDSSLFFQYQCSKLEKVIPITKRELARFSQKQLLEFIDIYQVQFRAIITIDDVQQLLMHAIQNFKNPNMKVMTKINLETLYFVGYLKFFPPSKQFEKMLKEIKKD